MVLVLTGTCAACPQIHCLVTHFLVRASGSFDAIPHRVFSLILSDLRAAWRADFLSADNRKFYNALPDRFTAFRGQNAGHPVGLSWTLNRDIASGFARGHRCLFNQEPIVISAQISKRNLCGAYVDREESEVVVFNTRAATSRRTEAIESLLARADDRLAA